MKRVLAVCVALAGLFQCSPYSADRPDGERLFQIHCASCHGAEGQGGRGPALAGTGAGRGATHRRLVRVIRSGIPGTEMPASKLNEDEIREIASWVGALGGFPAEQVRGDAKRGEGIYVVAGCSECHTIAGWGGAFGPDLTAVGVRRSVRYLRAAILDPQADLPNSLSSVRSDVRIPQTFLQVTVDTQDGRKLTGIRINEDAFSMQLRDRSGRMISLDKRELRELRREWGRSPMPAYGEVLSEQQVEDLVAYLVSLRD
jgi:putative heme-binding domain-containing protein